jgi:hypothetical protein
MPRSQRVEALRHYPSAHNRWTVDFDDTGNIFIEGDNLEVLKLLQKAFGALVAAFGNNLPAKLKANAFAVQAWIAARRSVRWHGCHAGVLEAHEKWLPNAALHFEVVSCPACHAPDAQRKVDLMLIDSKDAQPRGIEQVGVPLFEASSHSGDKGIDAQALWNVLQTLNRSGIAGKTVLRGRLEASTGPQAHQLADKSKAISDCRTCHSAGSQAFQNVTISLVQPQGQRLRYGANADVLNSPISLESVGGFYAIGATRIKLLDILVILAILGGLGFAVGHLTLGWIFKYYGLNHPGGHGGGHGGQPGDGQGHKVA